MGNANKMKTLNGYEICDAATRQRIDGIITTGTGEEYTATVSGIDELTPGISFIIIPHVDALVQNPTLNVNELGAVPIRQRLSNSVITTTTDFVKNWIRAGYPLRVTYTNSVHDSFWVTDMVVPDLGGGIYGTLKVENGGTGGKTAVEALNNLGIVWGTDIAPTKGTPNSIYIQIN